MPAFVRFATFLLDRNTLYFLLLPVCPILELVYVLCVQLVTLYTAVKSSRSGESPERNRRLGSLSSLPTRVRCRLRRGCHAGCQRSAIAAALPHGSTMRRRRRRCSQTRRFRLVSANATSSCADRSCSCAVRVSCSERLKSYGAPRPRRGRARGASCPARLSGRVSSRNSDRRASMSSRDCTPRLQRRQRRPTRPSRHRKRRASPLPVRLRRSLNGLARSPTCATDARTSPSSSQEEVEGNADEMVADSRLARRSRPRRFDLVQAGVGQGQGTHGRRLCTRAGSLAGAHRDGCLSYAPEADRLGVRGRSTLSARFRSDPSRDCTVSSTLTSFRSGFAFLATSSTLGSLESTWTSASRQISQSTDR